MSIKIMSEVWEYAPLVGTDLLLLMALADMANDDRRECWPGLKSLAHKARISPRQVSNILSDLEVQGIITTSARMTEKGANTSNLYRINDVTNWEVLKAYEDDNTPMNHRTSPPRTVEHPPIEPQNIPPDSIPPVEVYRNPQYESPSEPITRKRVKKDSKDTIPASQMNAMKDAIVVAFGWDAKGMTKPEWGIVQKSAKILCTAGFETERVASFHTWCKAKFTTFTPITMTTHLSEYRAARLQNNQPNRPTSWDDIPELRGIKEIIR